MLAEFVAWMDARRGFMVAGCNVAFDIGFLEAAMKRCNIKWQAGRSLDIRGAAWLAYETGGLDLAIGKDGTPRLSLESISGALGLSRTGEKHNALEDALLTLACFRELLGK